MRVITASNGKYALSVAIFRRARFDLMVTNMLMPEKEGRELANRMASVRSGLKIPYISHPSPRSPRGRSERDGGNHRPSPWDH